MLMLSYFCRSKHIWSVRCGSAGCGAINERSFGGPDKEWYIKLIILGSTIDFPKKHKIIDKGIS